MAKAWSNCSATTGLRGKLKLVGDYIGFPLDIGRRLVLAKAEQLRIYQNPDALSEADRLNGYVWKGVVTMAIEGQFNRKALKMDNR